MIEKRVVTFDPSLAWRMASVCVRDTINRSINNYLGSSTDTTARCRSRGPVVDAWEFVGVQRRPPVSLYLHISRECLSPLRNSSAHQPRTIDPRCVLATTRKYRSGRNVFANGWKTRGIRAINLRSWNWFVGSIVCSFAYYFSQGWRFPAAVFARSQSPFHLLGSPLQYPNVPNFLDFLHFLRVLRVLDFLDFQNFSETRSTYTVADALSRKRIFEDFQAFDDLTRPIDR